MDFIVNNWTGFITGLIAGLSFSGVIAFIVYLVSYVVYKNQKKDKPRFIRTMYGHDVDMREMQEVFKEIGGLFHLDHTVLLSPDIPEGAGYSTKHAFTDNSYFEYLIQQGIKDCHFRIWGKGDQRYRSIDAEIRGARLAFDIHLTPGEIKRVLQLLDQHFSA